jgi:hypothetical protein
VVPGHGVPVLKLPVGQRYEAPPVHPKKIKILITNFGALPVKKWSSELREKKTPVNIPEQVWESETPVPEQKLPVL